MNYWNKDKKGNTFTPKVKRTNWNQSLRSATKKVNKTKKVKKYLVVKKTSVYL